MDFNDALAAAKKRPGTTCGYAKIVAALKPSDRDQVSAAMAEPSITTAQIGRALGLLGHKVAGDTLSRHRRGDCRACAD